MKWLIELKNTWESKYNEVGVFDMDKVDDTTKEIIEKNIEINAYDETEASLDTAESDIVTSNLWSALVKDLPVTIEKHVIIWTYSGE